MPIFPETVTITQADGQVRIELDPAHAEVRVGGNGLGGALIIEDDSGHRLVEIEASGSARLGGNSRVGELLLLQGQGNDTVHTEISAGRLRLGVTGTEGRIQLTDNQGVARIILNGRGSLVLGGGEGGLGADGDLRVLKRDGSISVHVFGSNGDIKTAGSVDAFGDLRLHSDDGATTVRLFGASGDVHYAGEIEGFGDLRLRNSAGDTTVHAFASNGDIHSAGDLEVVGDIKLIGSDCAEEFEVALDDDAGPGSVMVIGADGRLRHSSAAYDTAVAGIVSGAGAYRPGIVLGRDPRRQRSVPIALAGRVHCRADATAVPITVGDLLTTSDLPGHAMVAADRTRTSGAVLGKALSPLSSGTGMVPVLVALQ